MDTGRRGNAAGVRGGRPGVVAPGARPWFCHRPWRLENRGTSQDATAQPPVNGHSPAKADVPDVPPPTEEALPPTTIPAGLPCAGQRITQLSPARLRMLLSKVDQLAAEQGRRWQPLLEALAVERQARLAKGQRPKPTPVAGDSYGA
jgi:hypothetical protein